MRRYNYATKQYENYQVPSHWKCPLVGNYLQPVNCASCGKELKFGHTCESLEIKSEFELSYYVCYPCYKKELSRELSSELKYL